MIKMNFLKKLTAASLAAVMGVSMAACHTGEDTKWVAKYGEETVPAGVYLQMLYAQYYTVTDELAGEDGELPKNPLKEQIDGVTVSQKMTEGAKKDLAGFIAVEEKFKELNLTLPQEQIQQVDGMLEMYWQYISPSYTENGISKDSYRMVQMNSAKKSAIFEAIYGEGGTEAVPEEELKEKYNKDVAKIMIIPLQLSKDEDAAVKAEADQKTRAKIDEYETRLKNGEDMETVYFDAQKAASSEPETLTQAEKGTSYTFVIREQSTYDEKVTEAIMSAPVGQPVKVENENSIYLFVRFDANENPEDFNSRKSALTTLLRQEPFNQRLEEWGAAVTPSYNDKALSRYTPEKLKMP